MINRAIASHYKWGADCDSWEFCNSKRLSVKLESMPPHSKEVLHLHSIKEQFFFVVNGTATFTLEGISHSLKPTEGLHIAPSQVHSIRNESELELTFLVITTPNIESDRINKI